MECIVCGTIVEHNNVHKSILRLYDGSSYSLDPTQPSLISKLNKLLDMFKLCTPLKNFVSEILRVLQLYYISSESPSLINVYNLERRILNCIFDSIRCCLTLKPSDELYIAFKSATYGSTVGNTPNSKAIIFDYCYFGHSMTLNITSDNRGVVIFTAVDKGGINISFDHHNSKGLMQVSSFYPNDEDLGIITNLISFDPNDGIKPQEPFISSVSLDVMRSFGTILFVTYSNCRVEVWKESVSIANFSDTIWESVAVDYVGSYPFYSCFSPSGELILVLEIDHMHIFEWNGTCLQGVNLRNGSTSDFWGRNVRILATEWLNNHEFLSLTANQHLILTRRNDVGQWNRIAQFDLSDIHHINTISFTNSCNRIQYDGNKQVYLLMSATAQIVKLKWLHNAVPECVFIDFPVKELLLRLEGKKLDFELQSEDKLQVADFVLDLNNSLIALILLDRNYVCIYNVKSLRLISLIEPPRPGLYAMGVKFLSQFISSSYLAVRWVTLSKDVMYSREEFEEVEHTIDRENRASFTRCTTVYKIGTAVVPRVSDESTLAEILANGSEVTSKAGKFTKKVNTHRWEPYTSNTIPQLTSFKPTLKSRDLGALTLNTRGRSDDTFINRHEIFGKGLDKDDFRTFPIKKNIEFDKTLKDGIFSIDEFIKKKRGLFD